MSVNRVDQQQPVVAPRTESPAPAARTETAQPAAPTTPAAPQSSFDTARTAGSAALGNGPARPSEHVAGSITPGTQTPVAPGPMSLRSREAQEAIEKSMEFIDKQLPSTLAAQGDASSMFDARMVEKDNLGMTHVRLDRTQDGLKVLNEQVITHLDRDGKVTSITGDASTIPAGLGNQPTKISADDALAKAKDAFGVTPENRPVAEKVLYKGDDGTYKVGYRVELRNVNGPQKPQNMNYVVDAQTGQIDRKWNTISGIELPKQAQRTVDPITVKGSAEPNAKINDNSTVTSKITINDDVSIEKLGVGLNLDHTYRGDLVVKLTSPSGKEAIISNRQGGSADNVTGNFDLSAFKGESSKGEWTLTVEDKAARDTGTLKQWGLEITGTPKTPPPPPPAPEATTIEKSASPNSKIEDNKAVTSTIDIPEGGDIDSLQLNLDLNHTYRGDLTVTLTSPSGKTATISNREGGSADNIKGTFDLTQFAGEKVTGQWKLEVSDKAAQDTGTLNSWGLKIKTKGNEPPPPPPPPPPPGTADDTSLYSGKVDVGASKNSAGNWVLKDTSRGQGVETRDAQNKSSPSGSVEITDNNNTWGEAGDAKNQKAAIDAQYGGQMTYDFFKNVLGRNSIDGQGEALRSNVHINKNYVNAYWDGSQMSYGDGDGKDAGPLTTLDIAGHEISHGLTERTANLEYSGESGGINESMSDIMGFGVEWYAAQQNGNVQWDWKMGEDCWTPANGTDDALRYMDDPTKDGYSVDNYKNYPKQTEVHGSSGILNNAFFLLSQGGTNRTSKITVTDGIGPEASLKIYGRALTFYMTPKTNFAAAREACIKAATDLYGADSVQVQKVKESMHAVGIG